MNKCVNKLQETVLYYGLISEISRTIPFIGTYFEKRLQTKRE